MTYRIITASQKSNFQETLLYKSLVKNCVSIDNVIFFGDNKDSLSVVYNKGLKICRELDIKIAVFIHDDVFINCSDFEYRIRTLAQKYPVTGLAGNSKITIKEPVLWHLMSGKENLRGCVAHGNDETFYYYTSFGPLPSKVVLIDGVFFIVNLQKLPEIIKFDENNPARFHFYDLMFSLDCNLAKIPVWVGDVPIIHNSPGLRDVSDEWKNGQQYFIDKYKKYYGKTLI